MNISHCSVKMLKLFIVTFHVLYINIIIIKPIKKIIVVRVLFVVRGDYSLHKKLNPSILQ